MDIAYELKITNEAYEKLGDMYQESQHFLFNAHKQIRELQDKLSRRNMQIKDLRTKNTDLHNICIEVARFISQEIADHPAEKTKRPEIFAMLDKAINR